MLDLNNKTLISIANTENGEVDLRTIFHYKQNGEIIWADYSGGSILKGSLIGKKLNKEEFEFNYQHISTDQSLKAGHCKTKVSVENGKIKLSENWKWFTEDQSSGHSELIEKKINN